MENRQSHYGTPSAARILVIALALSLNVWSAETVLHSFAGPPTDGANPTGGLISDSAGNLYGTTFNGGANSAGAVFKIDTSGNETVLYSFTGGSDGGFPAASLVFGNSGILYGTTTCGGDGPCSGGTGGDGVVFALTPEGSFSVLHTFTGNASSDGSRPLAPLIFASGNLYGTTEHGGTGGCATSTGSGCGVVFELSLSRNETVLYRFTGGTDGGRPLAPVVSYGGNLYGTTFTGGNFGAGTIFKLDSSNVETVLHHFTGGTGGGFPTAGLIAGTASQLYGTATCGGSSKCVGGIGGSGVVFVQWLSGTYAVLHTFLASGGDGANPNAGLVFSVAGNLYGTTFAGGHSGCNVNGTKGCGVVFKLQPTSRAYTQLYAFTGAADGGNPYSGVILGAGLPAMQTEADMQMVKIEPQKKGGCTGACGATTRGGGSSAGVVYQVTPVQ